MGETTGGSAQESQLQEAAASLPLQLTHEQKQILAAKLYAMLRRDALLERDRGQLQSDNRPPSR